MELDEVIITRAIFDEYSKTFLDYTEVDVALIGGGPANLVAAKYLAEAGAKVAIYEQKLSLGGGMWAGGMMFPRIVLQEEACRILDDFGIRYKEYQPGYYVANSVESVGKLIAGATSAGAEVFNLVSFEDVMIRENDRVTGIVINWGPVTAQRLHVDPLMIRTKLVIDGTGHEAVVCNTILRKIPNAKIGNLGKLGEKPMWSEVGERLAVDATKEIYPGLIVAGMAANAATCSPRMGPVFGGMLLSGEKAAKLALEKLKEL
ncbi:sulfide-dependent adenosine diphosphate thiazole synthase [Methanosarcina sp. Kolksee]|uniref:sulfide-dependent adenosine diphosphate thiazole synthase n=1 Tax=Methanosarcina sp. Kolksee TaxID=1434099 RepID=UPI00064EDE6F|nr:sulfide-dependent adenosine diphosphate thiazole synthase [Methanosarcina sp. Kolksee]